MPNKLINMSYNHDKNILKRYVDIKSGLKYGIVISKYAAKSVKILKNKVTKSSKYNRIYRQKGYKNTIKCHVLDSIKCSPGQKVKYVMSKRFSRTKSAIVVGVLDA